jgi:hypothetical protein
VAAQCQQLPPPSLTLPHKGGGDAQHPPRGFAP